MIQIKWKHSLNNLFSTTVQEPIIPDIKTIKLSEFGYSENIEMMNFKQKLSQLNPLLINNAIIAGGCFKDLYYNKTPKDIDLFFRKYEDYEKMLHDIESSDKFYKTHHTNNSMGFQNIDDPTIRIELIHKIYGTPQEIIDTFDFSVTKFALYIKDNQRMICYHDMFYYDLTAKILSAVGNPTAYDANELFNRVLKYHGYGYRLTIESKAILFNKIQKFNGTITSIDVINKY